MILSELHWPDVYQSFLAIIVYYVKSGYWFYAR